MFDSPLIGLENQSETSHDRLNQTTMTHETICPSCGAHNEPDSNFCDQCSGALQTALPNNWNPPLESTESARESLPWGLIFFLSVLLLTLLLAVGAIVWHYSP